jgi:tRNA-dihydrouridine synthase C
MQLALAPMEGLVDDVLRDVLTRVGGVDWCVSEFVRVTDALLPKICFTRLAPELATGARTAAGTQMRLQLLGSDPACLADNAMRAVELGAPVIDLNFGCPAKKVNNSRGGAILLREPELLHAIVREVRRTLPAHIPVTAKMRLGFEHTGLALECAQALDTAGAAQIVVHARTKMDGYRPPAHWEWIARIDEIVEAPVYANGEIWTVEDWQRCRAISGVDNFMLGRGLIARPDLARRIRACADKLSYEPLSWDELMPSLQSFWRQVRARAEPKQAQGRLKQWLSSLALGFAEGAELFAQVRREKDCEVLDRTLGVVFAAVAAERET